MARITAAQVKLAQDKYNYQKARLQQAQSKSGGRAMGQMNVASAAKALASRQRELASIKSRYADQGRREALEEATAKAEQEAAEAARLKAEADRNKAEDGTTIVAPPTQVAPPTLAPPQAPPQAPILPPSGGPPMGGPAPPVDPNPAPDVGFDPITGNPIGPAPTPEQGGDLPPNYVPPPNSRDWLGHVLTPTGSLLPQQLERGGPIRRVTPVSQLFGNPINSGGSGAPSTAMGNALRGG